jgi:hypothetical protein
MSTITGPSGRVYDPLPIDNSAGLPQSFSLLLNGVSYFFNLYVNIAAAALPAPDAVLSLPADNGFLVISVDSQPAGGDRTTVLLRKVVPSLEYSAGALMLYFPQQQVAVANLNGQGDFGTSLVGGVAQQ